MNMMEGFGNWGGNWMMQGGGPEWFMSYGAPAIGLLAIWSLVWKGMALWKAAHEESKPWFVALLIFNTVGILDILYLYVFSKKGSAPATAPPSGDQKPAA